MNRDVIDIFRAALPGLPLGIKIVFGTMPLLWIAGWLAWRIPDPPRKLLWLRRVHLAHGIWFVAFPVAGGAPWFAVFTVPLAGFIVWLENRSMAVCPDCGQFVADWGIGASARCPFCDATLTFDYDSDPDAVLGVALAALKHFNDEGLDVEVRTLHRYIEASTGRRVPRASIGRAVNQLERRGLVKWDGGHWHVSPKSPGDTWAAPDPRSSQDH